MAIELPKDRYAESETYMEELVAGLVHRVDLRVRTNLIWRAPIGSDEDEQRALDFIQFDGIGGAGWFDANDITRIHSCSPAFLYLLRILRSHIGGSVRYKKSVITPTSKKSVIIPASSYSALRQQISFCVQSYPETSPTALQLIQLRQALGDCVVRDKAVVLQQVVV